jgi:membrane protein
MLWTVRDYAIRVWDNSGEDNVLFLAGGIAFNLILAALPFILLLAAGVGWLVPLVYHGDINSTTKVLDFIDGLLPAHNHGETSSLDKLMADLMRTASSVTIYSALVFTWFSTRLFGSLRTVLASVFDIESERGIIAGKIFDVKITIVSTLLFVASVTVNSYVTLASSSGATALVTLGLRRDVMDSLEASLGRVLAFAFITLMFFALYKYLPIRQIRTKTAWVAAGFTSFAFEAARVLFALYATTFNPGSLYTGTLTAIIVVIVWFYYAAVVFLIGGEVGQVFELRRVRKLQREVFTD